MVSSLLIYNDILNDQVIAILNNNENLVKNYYR